MNESGEQMKKKKPTKNQLKRQIEILEADTIYRLAEAHKKIICCSPTKYMGSGVTLTIKNINKDNYVICEEFIILDGLSPDTSEAIRRDIERTYNLKKERFPIVPTLPLTPSQKEGDD